MSRQLLVCFRALMIRASILGLTMSSALAVSLGSANLTVNDVTPNPSTSVTAGTPFTPIAGNAMLGWTQILAGLDAGHVTVTTSGGVNASESGSLTIEQSPNQAGNSGAYNKANNLTFSTNAGGILSVNAAIANSGSGGIVFTSASGISLGANITTAEGGLTFSGPVSLTAPTVLGSTGSAAITFNSTVNGGQSLTVNTAGTTTFGSAVGGTNPLTSLTTDAGGTTAINTAIVTTSGGQTYGDAVTLGANTTLTGSTVTFNGTVAGGTNNLAIVGNAIFGDVAADTVTGLGVFSVSGTTAINTSAITSTSAQTYTGTTTLGTNTTLTSSAAGIHLGAITGNNHDLTIHSTINGSIGGVAAGLTSLTKTGNGTLTLSAANTYTGLTTVTNGTLMLGSGGSLASGNSVAVIPTGDSAMFDLNNQSQTIGNITLGGATTTSAARVLIQAFLNSGDVLSLEGGDKTSGPSVQNGGPVLTLTGGVTFDATNNPLGGRIETGTLDLGAAARTFNVGQSTSSGGGGGDLEVWANLSGAGGGVIKTGLGRMTLSGNNSYSGSTTVNNGRLQLSSNTAVASGNNVVVDAAPGATAIFDVGGRTVTIGTLTLGGSGSATSTSNVDIGPGLLTLGGTVTYLATNNPLGSTISGVNGTSTSLHLGATRTFDVGDSTNAANDLTISSVIGDGGSAFGLTKTGAGTLALTGANTYTGATTISAGTLVVGGGNTSGSIAGDLVNNSKLTFNSVFNPQTYGGVISGTGTLEKLGNNRQTLTGANTYTGATTISGGTLSVMSLADGGAVSGIGQSTNAAANLVLNGGYLEYTGGTASTDRLFTLGAGAGGSGFGLTASGTGPITFSNTGSIAFTGLEVSRLFQLGGTNTSANTLASVLGNHGAGTTSLTKTDAGNWVLTGANTYSGSTTIHGGTLTLGNSLALQKSLLIYDTAYPGVLSFGPLTSATVGGLQGSKSLSLYNANEVAVALTVDSSLFHNYSAVLSGPGSLIKTGTGTLALTGTNTYTGGTTISGGILNIGSGGATGSIAGDVINNATLMFNRSDSTTFDGIISGTGAVVQNGPLTLTLTGANTYAGGTTINNTGRITALNASGSATGTGTVTLFGVASELRIGDGGTVGSISGNIVMNPGSGGVTFNRSNDFSYGGVISGSNPGVGVTKTGAGTLTLNGQSTYTGPTNVLGGTLTVGTTNALPTTGLVSVFNAGSTLRLSANQTVSNLTMDPTAFVSIDSGSALTFNASSPQTVAGVLTGAGSFNKSGFGSVTLTGGNTYTGATSINQGTLSIGSLNHGGVASSIGQSPNAAANLVISGGTLLFTGEGGNTDRLFTIGTAGATLDASGVAGALTFSNTGTIALSGTNVSRQLTLTGSNSGANSLASILTDNGVDGAGVTMLNKNGSGQWVLSGANTFSGTTNINQGTLTLDHSLALQKSPLFYSTAGGTLSFGTVASATIGGLSGAKDLSLFNNNDAGVALTIDTTQSYSYSGILSGPGSLTKAGAGTTTVTGANTYTGGTTINGGFFNAFNPTGSATGTGTVTINSGVLAIGNGSNVGAISGDIVNNASVYFARSDPNTYAGVISGTGFISQVGSGTLTLTGANTFAGMANIMGGTLAIGNGGTTGSIVGEVGLNNGTLQFNRSNAYAYAGSISGEGSVRKLGSGALTLSGVNSYAGDTFVEAGSLADGAVWSFSPNSAVRVAAGASLFVNHDEIIGGLTDFGGGAGTVTIAAERILAIAANDNGLFRGVISGAGALQKQSRGQLTLDGANLYTGGTTILGGTLRLGSSGQLPAGTNLTVLAIDTGSAVMDLGGRTQTIGTLLLGGGYGGFSSVNVGFGSGGTLTLGGTVTYNATDDPSGAMISGGNLALGANRTIEVGDSTNAMSDLTISSAIGGAGFSLTKTGPGTLQLTGSNTFSGGLNFTEGALYVGRDNAAGTGLLTLGSNTIIGVVPSTSGSAEVMLANSVSLGNNVSIGDGQTESRLTLSGSVVAAQGGTTNVNLNGKFALVTTGPLSGGTFSFQGNGTAALFGTTTGDVIANGAGVLFGSTAALGGSIQAANGGYIGTLGVSPETVMARISTPASFAGTFGFDSDLEHTDIPLVYAGNYNFSAFTNESFTLGSTTAAVLTGNLTRPAGSGSLVFGNGGGVLFVQSNLSGEMDVKVRSNSSGSGLTTVFRGNNTYTGELFVENSAVVFDSPTALPGGLGESLGPGSVSHTGRFTLSGQAYFGATEAFGSASDFLYLLYSASAELSAHTPGPLIILGLDSHAAVERMMRGPGGPDPAPRVICDDIDLYGFGSSLALGTLTQIDIHGNVSAPEDGTLNLIALDHGHLRISSSLNDLTQLVIGTLQAGGGTGTVELANEYNGFDGDTVLNSGTLLVRGDYETPLGYGVLTVPQGAVRPVLASSSEEYSNFGGSESYTYLENGIHLNTTLQLGLATFDDQGAFRSNLRVLELGGDISGPGGIRNVGNTILDSWWGNSYQGETVGASGTLIFAGAHALPYGYEGTGPFRVESAGYIGIVNDGEFSLQSNFIDRFDRTRSTGTIGLDSFEDGYSEFYGCIDLTGFGPSIRLGSATYARFHGDITPASPGSYRFGGGGGMLEIFSGLSGTRSLIVDSNNQSAPLSGILPLTLLLTGENTYTGGTIISQSAVLFTPGSIPAGTNNITLNRGGYAGLVLYGDEWYDADEHSGGELITDFLAHIPTTANQGFVGFDGYDYTPITISDPIDLGSRNGVYLSTTGYLALAGPLTFGDGNYRFAGYKGGLLMVGTDLTGTGSVKVGEPFTPATLSAPDGTPSGVALSGNNSYSGGTDLYAGYLVLGFEGFTLSTASVKDISSLKGISALDGVPAVSSALGTGALRVQPNFFAGEGSRHLLNVFGDLSVPNNIELLDDLNVAGQSLFLTGNLSGTGELYKLDSSTLTLSGNNSGFSGGIYIREGNVTFANANSVGAGPLGLGGPASPGASFLQSSLLNGIFADDENDTVGLPPSGTLTINQTFNSEFAGSFQGSGALLLQNNSANTVTLRLSGNSTYSGGTTIATGVVVLVASDTLWEGSSIYSGPFGQGPITLNGGSLTVERGVQFGNSLILMSGLLSGNGHMAPTSTLIIGGSGASRVVLSPGDRGPGTLTFSGENLGAGTVNTASAGVVLSLAGGGGYDWQLSDPINTNGGWDSITVSGTVDVTATPGNPFKIQVFSTLADGTNGTLSPATFNLNQPYTPWTILTATTITNFNAANFVLDTSTFLTTGAPGIFSLQLNVISPTSSTLALNFTAVPEPSTYMLMGSGLAFLAFVLRRRRAPRG